MTGGPLHAYRALLDSGELTPDPAQCLAADKLQSLHNALKGYEPARAGSWKARFGLTRRSEEPPMGLYIYGDVGRGKSMLMDLFFETAPVEKKRRVHFHEFMLELHDTLHVWRRDGRAGGKEGKHVDDLLTAFAESVAADAWVLCFDEFHVDNIADAMLLGRLFQALFDLGVIVISTSNWPPDDLYKDGLQRELFEPFIALIKDTLDVLELTARRDYRLARLMSMKVYHLPLGPKAERALASAFTHLTDGAAGAPSSLAVKGRTVPVPRTARGVACFTFAGLCGQPLGAADYIAVARAFHSVILSGVQGGSITIFTSTSLTPSIWLTTCLL